MSEQIKTIIEPARELPVREHRDVVVAGGGLTGVMAAVAAAQAGADTLLIEMRSHLGAVATMGLPLQGYCDRDERQIVRGLAEEFRQRLMAIGGATEFIRCTMHNPYIIIDPESVKLVCQQMIEEAGVSLLYNTPVVNVLKDGKRIQAVVIEGKSGREAVIAKNYIDCTGDADLAFRAGAECDLEQPDKLQTSTLNLTLTNVDIDKVKQCLVEQPEEYKLFELLNKDLVLKNPRFILVGLAKLAEKARLEHPEWQHIWNIACYITQIAPGTVTINSVHMDNLCACDTRDLTKIEMLGRLRAQEALAFYRGYIPGFENARLASSGPWAGIRETRRLRGVRCLTVDSIVAGECPPDTIAMGGYPIDIHDPDTNQLVFYKVPAYGIPYGCMLSPDVENLLVAGRAISATHEAMASSRVMAQCMALGEAAGTAAAMASSAGISPHVLNIDSLRALLRKNGQFLE